MILTCPQCDTRYQADGSKFPAAGRNVRCAKCGHVWHQLGPEPEPDPEAELFVEEPPRPPEPPSEPEPESEPIAVAPRVAAFAPELTPSAAEETETVAAPPASRAWMG